MKSYCRRFLAATAFVAVLLAQSAPIASAVGRDVDDRDFSARIVQFVKKFFSIRALDELPVPPRP